MDLDPHTLQQIIQRIYQQMRCPQCGKRVPIDFASVRVAGDDFMLLQLRCETCDAHIVLHATLQGTEHIGVREKESTFMNESSTLHFKESELKELQKALELSGGSFEKVFEQFGGREQKDDGAEGRRTGIV